MKMTMVLLGTLATCATEALAANQCDFQIYGKHSGIEIKDIAAQDMKVIQSESGNVKLRSVNSVTENWKKISVSFTPSHSGEVQIKLGTSSEHGNTGIGFDAFKITGAKLRNPSFEILSGGAFEGWAPPSSEEPPRRWPVQYLNRDDAKEGKNYFVVLPETVIFQEFSVFENQRVNIEFYAKLVPDVKEKPVQKYAETFENNYPKEFYRLYIDVPKTQYKNGEIIASMKYLPLKHKGVNPQSVALWYPMAKNGSPVPEPKFVMPEKSEKGELTKIKIPVELLEESGESSVRQIRFGFPLPQGGIFDVGHLRVIAPDGEEIPAQFTASAFWKDGSVKVILTQFAAKLNAKEKAVYFVEAGKKVSHSKFNSPLQVKDEAGKITVNTGCLTAEVDKNRSGLFSSIRVNGKEICDFSENALELRDESGKIIPMLAPKTVKIEERGACRVTLLLSGNFGSDTEPFGSYVARIGFFANSAVVNFDIRFIDTNLRNEFFDLTSLALVCHQKNPAVLTLGTQTGNKFFMADEKSTLAEFGYIQNGDNKITFDVVDAKYRYPKGFAASGNTARFELLPEQPNCKFGADLPCYLQFPLCEGKYRLKWGMAFSQEIRFDFSGKTKADTLAATAIVPVIDKNWLHKTAVWQGVGAADENSFAIYDQKAVEAFYEHMKLKKIQREYGFLNYGDWFGERQRNWGNNEYDFASGLFLLFLRTGNRDVFRWAKIAARHQADVDIIHAYPDPAFWGANAQHSIGHTGVSYQRIKPPTWSFKFNHSFFGINGHTWAAGMCQAFTLAGDTMTMDSALQLGEHLTNYSVPYFKRLTTHQRSAGWSGKALMELYNATGDIKYFNAAKRLAELVIDEQKFEYGGAWPHKLPSDHAVGLPYVYGNCCYLVGIVLEFLRQVEIVEPTPELHKSILAAGTWNFINYQTDQIGWGYGVSWDHQPCGVIINQLNPMVAPCLAITARVSGDKKMLDALESVWDSFVINGFSPIGKDLAFGLINAPSMMDEMRRFSAEHPEKPLYKFSAARIENTLRNYKNNFFCVRDPGRRVYKVVLTDKNAKFTIERKNFESFYEQQHKVNPYSITLIEENGKKIVDKKSDLYSYEEQITLNGNIGQEFTLTLNDETGIRWLVNANKGCVVYYQAEQEFQIRCGCVQNVYLTVPAGVTEFDITVTGTHDGPYMAWVFDGDKKVAAVSGVKYGNAPSERKMHIKCEASAKARVLQLTLRSSYDVKLSINDIPAFICLDPAPYLKK